MIDGKIARSVEMLAEFGQLHGIGNHSAGRIDVLLVSRREASGTDDWSLASVPGGGGDDCPDQEFVERLFRVEFKV